MLVFHVNQCTCMLGAELELFSCIRKSNKLQTHYTMTRESREVAK